MTKIKLNWTKPVELSDGTPIVADDNGDAHHVDIRTTTGGRHPAFPIGRTKGSARRECGLVTSNHSYHVRNIDGRTIDFTFRVGDTVTCTEFPGTWQIEKIKGLYYTLKNRNGEIAGNLQAKHLRFACHNHNAPFTTISADHERDFADGYQSGLAVGLTNDFYQAGGPGGIRLHTNASRCRHLKEHDEIDEQRNKSWCEGWRAGQGDARTHKVDWTKPVEALGSKGQVVAAIVTRWTAPAVVEVFIDGKTYQMNMVGSIVGRNFSWVVRNKQPLTRVGYGIFGQTHTSLFSTLEEVSEHWWKTRDPARGTKQLNGEFIVRLEQTRETGHDSWTTISTSGPIEPLPAPPKIDVRYQYAAYGCVTGSTWDSEDQARKAHPNVCEGVLKITRTDGKLTNVEFLP